jgi:hypothetical protein
MKRTILFFFLSMMTALEEAFKKNDISSGIIEGYRVNRRY